MRICVFLLFFFVLRLRRISGTLKRFSFVSNYLCFLFFGPTRDLLKLGMGLFHLLLLILLVFFRSNGIFLRCISSYRFWLISKLLFHLFVFRFESFQLFLEFLESRFNRALVHLCAVRHRKAFDLAPYLFDHDITHAYRIFGYDGREIGSLELGSDLFFLLQAILLFFFLTLFEHGLGIHDDAA